MSLPTPVERSGRGGWAYDLTFSQFEAEIGGRSDKLKELEMVILGAGPGGLAAAVEAARSGVSVTILDEEPQAGRADLPAVS